MFSALACGFPSLSRKCVSRARPVSVKTNSRKAAPEPLRAGNAPLVGVITGRRRAEVKDPDDFARPIEGNFLFECPVRVALIGVLALAFALVEPVDKRGDAVLDAGITAAVDRFKRFDLPAALDEFPRDEAMASLGLAHRADAPRGAELLGEIRVVFDLYAKVRVPVAKPEEQ